MREQTSERDEVRAKFNDRAGARFHPFRAWLVAQLLYVSVDVNTILPIIMSTLYVYFNKSAFDSRSPNPDILYMIRPVRVWPVRGGVYPDVAGAVYGLLFHMV